MTSVVPSAVPAALPVLDECCEPSAPVETRAAEELAAMFRALADPARVKIMAILLNADGVSARDVALSIGKSAGTASHHLKLLRDAGLIAGDKRGTWIYYRAVPERIRAIRDALAPSGVV